MVVIAILTVVVSAMTGAVVNVAQLVPTNQESGRALDAARGILETLKSTAFDEVYARYNASPADDPGGPGTAPGSGFTAAGLSPLPTDLDGMVGAIEFPEVGGVLSELAVDDTLGMPMDLNRSGDVQAGDRSGDYRIFPIRIRLEWTGSSGTRSMQLHTVITTP